MLRECMAMQDRIKAKREETLGLQQQLAKEKEDIAAAHAELAQLIAAIRRVRRLVPGAREVELAAHDTVRVLDLAG